jgi:hypothetical protein
LKNTHQRLVQQLSQLASEGMFGHSIKESQQNYDQLKLLGGVAVLIQVACDFQEETERQVQEINEIRSRVCQLLIVAYREAKRKDPEIALAFVHSFIEDYPSIPESSLLTRWCSLTQSSLAAREISHSQNRLLTWQIYKQLFQSYNEFLNGLLSYLIILWRTSLGKTVNLQVFDTNYANKVNDFNTLTGGENGVFYIFGRLARPKIRNAIAHESIWFDSEAMKVRFTDGRGNTKIESEMDFTEFIVLAGLVSHLAHAYIAAISVIAVMEDGTDFAKSLLPHQLVQVFNYLPDAS